jgi:hypothetical protein
MNDYLDLLARASPPEFSSVDDLASFLDVDPEEAERLALVGGLGPSFFVRGRVCGPARRSRPCAATARRCPRRA